MTEDRLLSSKINGGVRIAIAQALERHRKLGEAIAVWQEGQVTVIPADQIPSNIDGLKSSANLTARSPKN
jgi:hypothetical protein